MRAVEWHQSAQLVLVHALARDSSGCKQRGVVSVASPGANYESIGSLHPVCGVMSHREGYVWGRRGIEIRLVKLWRRDGGRW